MISLPVIMCERCSAETHKPEQCGWCNRRLGRECLKSQKKLHGLERIAICKDCWGVMERRNAFKRAV